MPAFNEVQKQRRAAIAERKRNAYGDPGSKKLTQRPQPLSISGKRKRKIFKKWRREQKEAIAKGLITMEDVEMAVADAEAGTSTKASKSSMKFNMKKSSKVKIKPSKKKGKNKKSPAAKASVDAMVE